MLILLTCNHISKCKMSDSIKELEKQFYSDGYRIGFTAFNNGFSDDSLYEAVKQLHSVTDEMIEFFNDFAQKHNQEPLCTKGCAWCCNQPVFAMDYELNYLQNFINEKLSPELKKRIALRAGEKRNRLSGFDEARLLKSKYSCALLENDVCTAYSARPVACRIYLSSNLESCRHFYHKPEDKSRYPELLYLPMRLGRMLNEGFRAALKINGVKAEEFRIEELIFVDNSDFIS